MGDQDMATFDDADWSEDSRMDECDPGAPLADQASSDRYPDYSHASFAYKLRAQILPNDEHREGFDNVRKLGTRILLPPALLSKQQDNPQLPQWIVNPFRTTQAHQTRSVLFT